jgi:hypothetical protein
VSVLLAAAGAVLGEVHRHPARVGELDALGDDLGQVIDSQARKSADRSRPVSGSAIVVKPIGGVVEMWKCGAPRLWSSSFHGPTSGSPRARS